MKNTASYNSLVDWNGNGKIDQPYHLQGQQCLVFYLGGIPTYTSGVISMSGFASSNLFPYAPATAIDPATPLVPVSPKRHGPYFNFVSSRLVIDPRCPMFPVYQDPYQAHKRNGVNGVMGVDQPYAYFSTSGTYNAYNPLSKLMSNLQIPPTFGDCSLIGANAYYNGLNASLVPQYTNASTFQIISAGSDGVFGSEVNPLTGLPIVPGAVSWSPTSGSMPVAPPPPLLLAAGLDTSGRPAGADDQSNFSSTLLGIGQN